MIYKNTHKIGGQSENIFFPLNQSKKKGILSNLYSKRTITRYIQINGGWSSMQIFSN